MQKNNLKIINCLKKHSLEKKLELIIYQSQLDIICLTETWLEPTQRLNVHNFHTHRKDIIQGRGSGVANLANSNLRTSPLELNITTDESNDLHPSDYFGISI